MSEVEEIKACGSFNLLDEMWEGELKVATGN